MTDTRTTVWLRWPDVEDGPLWVGAHLNRRAGRTALVGLEVWTEPPGSARTSLGPDDDGAADLLPWPPAALTTHDIRRVRLPALRAAIARLLPVDGPTVDPEPLYGPDHYARVAGVYERALANGSHSPTADVAEAWSVSRSAAGRWVMRARRDGLITAPAPRRRR